MTSVKIRTLHIADSKNLLRFELDNREWFERHVDARASSFYSLLGVTAHIESYLSGLENGTWHPFVIEDDNGKIVGRANLKDINLSDRSAEVGYRIAESACGQGLATLAVSRLIEEGKLRWNLKRLVANVYAENVGSAKVLKRCGFSVETISKQVGLEDDYRFTLSI